MNLLKVTQQVNSNISPVITTITFSVTLKVMQYKQEMTYAFIVISMCGKG